MHSHPDGMCDHAKVCGRYALKSESKCILHLEDPNKSEDAFDQALDEHLEKQGPNFDRMVFPSGLSFKNRTFENGLRLRDAVFFGPVVVYDCIFDRGVSAPRAVFKSECTFSDCAVRGGGQFREAHFESLTDFTSTSLERADFSYASFGGETKFSECDFAWHNFALATFENIAHFQGAAFEGRGPQFDRTTFKDDAWFRETSFEASAFFSSKFEGEVSFARATFESGGSFRGTEFDEIALFDRAIFQDSVSFEDSKFGQRASFEKSIFREEADFTDATVRRADFSGAKMEGEVIFSNTFTGSEDVPFENACFDATQVRGSLLIVGKGQARRPFETGSASFQSVTQGAGATIRFRHADLSRCRFRNTNLLAPEFVGVKWCDEVGQEGWLSGEWFRRVGVHDEIAGRKNESSPERETGNQERTPWPEVERLYRQLKKNYEERGDFPRAGDFHIGEKEARGRHEERWGPWCLLTVYRWFSIYGERPLPASIWLVALVFGCALGYILMDASTGAAALSSISADWGTALVLSGEATLFPVRAAGFEGTGPRALNLFQRAVSPVLIALLALALRQRVKR